MAEVAIFRVPRSIGGIVAKVTIEETGLDELQITEHPVEQGAAIADHAFKRPARLTIRAGWTNSSEEAGGDESYVTNVYTQLLALQASRKRFDIITGKRTYKDMLFRSLSMTTDERTETALFVQMVCQQVIIVTTQVVTVPSAAVMAQPKLTAPIQSQGQQQASPAPTFNGQQVP